MCMKKLIAEKIYSLTYVQGIEMIQWKLRNGWKMTMINGKDLMRALRGVDFTKYALSSII